MGITIPRLFHMLAWFSVLGTVIACEGECIVGITNAFIKNYDSHVQAVFSGMADEIVARVFPHRKCPVSPMSLVEPMVSAYKKDAYSRMEKAIFPSYFHGKCLLPDSTGALVTPPGCPNPNCPVVCGTPGSLVHFYPKLRYIAFNETRNTLKACGAGSQAFDKVYNKVMTACDGSGRSGYQRRYIGKMSRGLKLRRQTEREAKERLVTITGEMSQMLADGCGGMHGLPNCSWEGQMKEYILGFP